MRQALESLTGHVSPLSPPPGSSAHSLPPLPAPHRRSWLSLAPLGVVLTLEIFVPALWTAVRMSDPRASSFLLAASLSPSTSSSASTPVSLLMLVSVWLSVSLALWSLAQTLRAQRANYVERSDQYVHVRHGRFDSVLAAGGRGAGSAVMTSGSGPVAAAAGTLPSFAPLSLSGSGGSADDASDPLFDLPDLTEILPGFVVEWTEEASIAAVSSSDSTQLLSSGAASPNSTRLLLSKRVPLGSPASAGSASLHARSASGGSMHSTPHILLPCLDSKVNGCRRWCTHCALYKPDRAHHCHTCGRCVKKLDHHCALLAACIGFANYKFFLLFISWSWAAASLILADVWLGAGVLSQLGNARRTTHSVLLLATGGSADSVLLLALVLILCGALAFALPLFLLFHLRLSLREGCTTLEWNELLPKRSRFLGADAHPRFEPHPYRLPLGQAWRNLFGFSLWKMAIPVAVWPSSAGGRRSAAAVASAASSQTHTPRAGSGVDGSGGGPLAAAAAAFAASGAAAGLQGGAAILRSSGRDGSGSPGTGADLDLDELSAVPLLSALTASGSPISSAITSLGGVSSAASVLGSTAIPDVMSKSELATVELAAWESRHAVPRELSKLSRLHSHPLYDRDGAATLAAAQADSSWASRGARMRAAAQGMLGREEAQCIAEWYARGLLFPTHPNVQNKQLALWREGKLFKQA